MKVDEVPQDEGMIGDYGQEVCYAIGHDGKYTLAPSLGWEVKNIVNNQAWTIIAEETKIMHLLVKNGKRSPIAYYQTRHQMDLGLLASYVNMARWRVKRHLNPMVFKGLPDRILQRYATVFGLSLEAVKTIPDTFTPELIRQR